MGNCGVSKWKRDQGKKDRIVVWKANIKGKDVAPIAGILFHDREEDEDGLDVDEASSSFTRSTRRRRGETQSSPGSAGRATSPWRL